MELLRQNRDHFRHNDQYDFAWHRLVKSSREGPSWPRARSGHQMIAFDGSIYLFGGWTGKDDLADFWRYDVTLSKWRLISPDTSKEGGPSPRSCFKMALDRVEGVIYILGRYVDRRARDTVADFYSYKIGTNRWCALSADTEGDGGPPLVFDHQLAFDGRLKLLFSFGGRVVRSTSDVPLEELRLRGRGNRTVKRYAGLFKWSAISQKWTQLTCLPDAQSRAGHGMVINDRLSKLYILGGTRSKVEMNDFIEIDYITEVS